VCHSTSIAVHPLVVDLPGISSYEREWFKIFRLQTAQDLPGLFQSKFWATIIPQVSHSEPAVLHAVVALGALHQRSVRCGMSIPAQDMTDKLLQFGLSHFNKSVSQLYKRMEDRESARILLMSCILFFSIELLRGHYGTAMLHLHNGRNILYDRLAQSPSVGPENVLILPSTSLSIEDELVEIFARLDIQSTHFGSNAPRFRLLTETSAKSAETRIPETFSGLREARQNFDCLANAIYRFITISPDPAFHNPANPIAVTQQNGLLEKLQEWSQAFEMCWKRLSTSPSPSPGPIPTAPSREAKTATLLRLQYKFLHVKLSVCNSCGVETIYDDYINDFEAIISLAGDLIGDDGRNEAASSTPWRLPTFSLDMGLIQPIYFTAMKCRVPQLRRRALSVLSSTPHREGMWDAALSATVAARTIQLEEAGLEDAGFSLRGGGTNDQKRMPFLPESARFYQVLIHILGEGAEGATLYCVRRRSNSPGDVIVREEYCAFDGGALVREILLS
jgi:hypothetical protein